MKLNKLKITAIFPILICTVLSAGMNKISVTEGGTVVFPKNNDIPGWGKVLQFDNIYRWGLSNSIYINKDSEPVVDGYAVYVHKDGSYIEFTDMKRFEPYYLFIDFVTFKGKSSGINSRLKIYADGYLLDELGWSELTQMMYYSKEIPREYYFDGIVKIELKEIDSIGGFWGIWDIALTDGKLPLKKEKIKYDFNPLIQKYISEKTERMKTLSPEKANENEFKIVLPDTPVEPSIK